MSDKNSLLHRLNDESAWQEYLDYKSEKGHCSQKELLDWSDFIEGGKYREVADRIIGGGELSIPEKSLINKLGGGKRVVYSFTDAENRVLKLLAYLLYAYDDKQPPKCYSFRKGFGAGKAIREIIGTPNISRLWCYKSDIRNYFNSISVPIMLTVLESVLDGDELLLQFFRNMLNVNKSVFEGAIIDENRGVMAGTPTSPFLSNLYLREMDSRFTESGTVYARYSDDVIIFAESEQSLNEYAATFREFVNKYELSVNPDKETVAPPGEAWEYLGIEFCNGKIDLSESTKRKVKGKIKRKARALRRWKLRKNAADESAMKVMIRVFNRKFFENNHSHDLTWSRWFFPLVTESDGFKEIDSYLQKYIRYIPTGSHGKKNYKTTYGNLKDLGYRSLVNEYYKFKKN
ncbi:MAG: reverse transcriptase domain-containing protein [Oscillospiraceae bacterium]|nr:reverse transcriptase domain-containing protein [Oscillospiraceae bacterium]